MAASDPRWVESVASLNWVWLPTGTNDGHFATILYLHLSEKLLRSWICLFQQIGVLGWTVLALHQIESFTPMSISELKSQLRQMCRYASRHEVRLLLVSTLLMLSVEIQTANAQQSYNNRSGYACTGRPTCETYALYRTQGSQSLQSIATLFNTTAAEIANASDINPANSTNLLSDLTPLYIPLSCGCAGGIYQAPTSNVVEAGETMYIISNKTYQGLTTDEAIAAANPTVVPTEMQPGQVLKIPLRCACPSTAQRGNNSTLLLTYAIFPDEILDVIGSRFGLTASELQFANNVTDPTSLLAFTTLLIPLVSLTPLSSILFPSPQPPPAISPSLAPAPTLATPVVSKDPSNTPLYIGVAVGAVGMAMAAIMACVLCATVRRHKRTTNNRGELDETSSVVKPPAVGLDTTNSSFVLSMSDVVGSDKPVKFSYEELLAATNRFSEDHKIQGSVYMGKLNGLFVAIKQMKGNMSNELKILSQVHHGNVVRLVGMCASSSENLYLVYEYADNGSLSDCLHYQMAYPSSSFSRSVRFLSWKLRVQIALDVASGLEYLHNYTNPSLVHKDVKSSNILLDRNFRAKVANFGMAQSAVQNGTGPIMTEHIVGTQGYMAPEYLEHGLVTTKADVFSFGVVLLEILSGREATFRDQTTRVCTPLSSTIFEVLSGSDQMSKLQAWMDTRLQVNAYPRDIAFNMASLAKSCVETDPALRPDMKDCSFAMSKICQASLEWDSSTRCTGAFIEAR